MKILIPWIIIIFIGCIQEYEVEKQPQKFDEINNPNFNWKSTSSTHLNFVIPDKDDKKLTLVEIFNVSNTGEEAKSVSQFLPPDGKFSMTLRLANHIKSVKVVMSQGQKHREKIIDVDDIQSISSIYFDEAAEKGGL